MFVYVMLLCLMCQLSGDSLLSKSFQRGTNTRSQSQTETSDITEHLQQIHEVISGDLWEITNELMYLALSNSF